MTERTEGSRAEGWVGLALMGGSVSGILAALTGVFAALSGEFAGAGVCFFAAGVAFGLPVNALLRR